MSREISSQEIEIVVHGTAPMTAFVARPAEPGAYPPVLVCAELWGLTGEVRDVARQVAALGHVAIAPDLYHRLGADTAHGMAESDANRERAFGLLARLTRDGVEADLRACLAHVREHEDATGKAGVLGFSLGGHVAFFAATRLDLAAAAIYYPGWLPFAGTALSRPDPLLDAAGEIGARVVMFFAELDHVIDAEQREQIAAGLTAAGVRHEEVVYPGARHAFFFPGREPYDKAAAEDSWSRVRALFAAELPPA
ncbi:dienelactone hydrolase family protein [Actinomadura sp. NPDC023710]|uniref:dienelactone hydrolase family protein n=1 Tax=Actinomadura sp. NPDC023710 TaxID=3158219 RepID=UPI003406AA70